MLKIKYTPENYNKVLSSYNVERAEIVGKFIHVQLVPTTQHFINTGQLSKQYVKNFILKTP